MALPSGTRLGPYEIRSFIGAGGMGVVYRARDTRLGRDVAVKVLPPLFARDADRLERFEREARAVAAINYTASLNGQRFLVMSPLVNPSASPLVGMLNWATGLTAKR